MVHTQNESSNETWSLYFSIQRGEQSKFKAKVNELKTGVVKVHSKTYGGGGLKYYLFEKFRAYLFKNIKNS